MDRQPTPLIPQRADPHILKATDGYYYFSASVPEYDRLELRRSKTIAGLANAERVTVWTKPDEGPYSDLIWAPEIHYVRGAWYIYFAAAPSREIKYDLFQHRMYAIQSDAANPLEGDWSSPVQVDTGIDTFCLDATVFEHGSDLYYIWAQKETGIQGNSNLYIAKMDTPLTLATDPVRLSIPEFDWETRGFWVNEGPSILKRRGKIFLSYSASATDENYAMGLLYADDGSDLLDASSWTKSKEPVLGSRPEFKHFGPGHNSFTVSEDGSDDMLVYHAREYTEIEGDPLWDPNRHTFLKKLLWGEDGMPVFDTPRN
ncbi:glycoside hydrolase family 43 protein [Pelagicoccus sp. SDUM812002]|uniref:glycoside hydrolase family 43 protein n=1 Tax=Pelagicoccus sp. SDUM812002 TaxID=3041266 RepID=UPI002810171D|nr:glycoside hydrolase family 43 protein [Pelagicoccus sp. SDUM812002]MDQ8185016.1 glycoside hydrolase family 43 protein [Pelagicoccus sp. SDUM812002]